MMRRFSLRRFLDAFGSLLDITARDQTDARRALDMFRNAIATRNDGDAIASCFGAVGRDLSVAMRQYENEQTDRKTTRVHIHINNGQAISPHGGKKSRRGVWGSSTPRLR